MAEWVDAIWSRRTPDNPDGRIWQGFVAKHMPHGYVRFKSSPASEIPKGGFDSRWVADGWCEGSQDGNLMICGGRDDEPPPNSARHMARGHGKVHVNRSKIPYDAVAE